MTGEDGVLKHQLCTTAARRIGRLHDGAINIEVDGGSTRHRGCLIHRHCDLDDIAGVESVVQHRGRCRRSSDHGHSGDRWQYIGDLNSNRLGSGAAQAVKGGDGNVVNVVRPRIQLVLEIGSALESDCTGVGVDVELVFVRAAQCVAHGRTSIEIRGRDGVHRASCHFCKTGGRSAADDRRVVIGNDLQGHVVAAAVSCGIDARTGIRAEVGVCGVAAGGGC